MRHRNPHAGLVVFWVKLRQRGYTRSISGLYRALRRMDGKPIKLPNPKKESKHYEQMQYPEQRGQIDVKYVVEKFPYAIACIQTDNGFEFTNRLANRKNPKPTLFEKILDQLGIHHKLIKPYTPRHNGKVERSHRKDNEEFYACHKFFNFTDFEKQLAVRQRQYNNFPMSPLNWKSPKHVLFSFPNV